MSKKTSCVITRKAQLRKSCVVAIFFSRMNDAKFRSMMRIISAGGSRKNELSMRLVPKKSNLFKEALKNRNSSYFLLSCSSGRRSTSRCSKIQRRKKSREGIFSSFRNVYLSHISSISLYLVDVADSKRLGQMKIVHHFCKTFILSWRFFLSFFSRQSFSAMWT